MDDREVGNYSKSFKLSVSTLATEDNEGNTPVKCGKCGKCGKWEKWGTGGDGISATDVYYWSIDWLPAGAAWRHSSLVQISFRR